MYRLLKDSFRCVGLEALSIKLFKNINSFNYIILVNCYRYCIFKKRTKKKMSIDSNSEGVSKNLALKLNKSRLSFFFQNRIKKKLNLKVKNIFSFKKNKLLGASQFSLKRSKANRLTNRFFFYKDTINILNFSFLLLKSELLSYFIAKLMKSYKNVRFVANNIKNNVQSFRGYQLLYLSLRISIFGKSRGASRTSSLTFSYGNKWPIQSINSKLSYDLAQT